MEELIGYHYTSIEAFYSMTKNMLEQKNSEKHFEFWASSCMHMNDYVELKHGYDVLMRIIEEEEMDIDEHLRLSNICKNIKMSDMIEEDIPSFIRDNSFNMDRLPYAISFSYMPEQIPLWAMYADNGRGVELCFDLNEILSFSELTFIPVIYKYDSIKDDYKNILRDLILPELQKLRNKIEKITDRERIWYEKYSCLRVLCTVLSPFFKHFSFEFENEYRLVKYCGREHIEYRYSSDGSLISYTKIKIPFTALKEVVVGPCSDYKLNYSKIETYMKYADPKHLVKVKPSLLPFRCF